MFHVRYCEQNNGFLCVNEVEKRNIYFKKSWNRIATNYIGFFVRFKDFTILHGIYNPAFIKTSKYLPTLKINLESDKKNNFYASKQRKKQSDKLNIQKQLIILKFKFKQA